jgi:hypothetical protein
VYTSCKICDGHSRFIPEGVAEAFRIFLPEAHDYQNGLAMRNTAVVTGGKLSAVLLSISGVSAHADPLIDFYDIRGERERCFSVILSRTPQMRPNL